MAVQWEPFAPFQNQLTSYTDFSKAFHKTDLDILFNVVSEWGFTPPPFKMVFYLKTGDRWLQITYNGRKSGLFTSTPVAPQVSNLGLLIFVMFINDQSSVVDCEHAIFTDDLKIYHQISCTTDRFKLQQTLNIMTDWYRTNCISVIISKCKMIYS